MSTENIIEGNKLIAEFMKIKIDHNGRYKAGYNSLYMKYNCSWDWLMPVVEKIEHLFETDNTLPLFDINSHFCRFSLGHHEIKEYKQWIYGCYITSPEENKCSTKIDAAWNVCVEFIKWYNSWKEKQ